MKTERWFRAWTKNGALAAIKARSLSEAAWKYGLHIRRERFHVTEIKLGT